MVSSSARTSVLYRREAKNRIRNSFILLSNDEAIIRLRSRLFTRLCSKMTFVRARNANVIQFICLIRFFFLTRVYF